MIKLQQRTYLQITGLIFIVIAVLHLLRVLLGWKALGISVAGWMVPGWISWIAVVVAGYLAYSAYKLMK